MSICLKWSLESWKMVIWKMVHNGLSQPNSQESSNLQWMKNRIHKQDFQSLGSRILKRDLLDSKGNFEVSPGLCPWTSLGYSTLPNFQLYVSSLLWLRRRFLGKNQIFPTGSLMNVRETKRESANKTNK